MRITLLALLATTACGGGSNTDLEGIYTVDAWNRNSTACDEAGAMDVKAQHEGFFYIKSESILGEDFVNVEGCVDLGECDSKANDSDTIHIGNFTFEDGSDSKGWTSKSAFAFNVQGQCMGGVTTRTMTSTATTVRIEERHVEALPFAPSTGDDECPDAKVEQNAAGQPCDQLEVVTATFTKDF